MNIKKHLLSLLVIIGFLITNGSISAKEEYQEYQIKHAHVISYSGVPKFGSGDVASYILITISYGEHNAQKIENLFIPYVPTSELPKKKVSYDFTYIIDDANGFMFDDWIDTYPQVKIISKFEESKE